MAIKNESKSYHANIIYTQFGRSGPGLPDKVMLSFLWTRLAEEGENPSAWPRLLLRPLEAIGRGCKGCRDHFLLLRHWPPSDHSKHPMGEAVMGLSSSSATGLCEAIPQSRTTSGSWRVRRGFGWLGCCTTR